jgi:hypothetical protein
MDLHVDGCDRISSRDFDLLTVSNITEYGIEALPDDYYLCWYSNTSDAAAAVTCRYQIAEDDGDISIGTGLNDTAYYVFHTQLEASGYPTSPASGTRNEDHLYWSAGDFSENILAKKFAVLFAPNWSASQNANCRVFHFTDTATGYKVQLYKSGSGAFTIRKYDGSWTDLVQITGLTWSRGQVLEFIINPSQGSIEVKRATTGGDEVSGTKWHDFLPTTSDLHWGSNATPDFQIDGVISEPWLVT